MTPKTDKTNRELILEVHQGIYNEKFISKAKGIAIGLGIVGSGGLGIGIWQIFG